MSKNPSANRTAPEIGAKFKCKKTKKIYTIERVDTSNHTIVYLENHNAYGVIEFNSLYKPYLETVKKDENEK